jgi:hypothetical protein
MKITSLHWGFFLAIMVVAIVAGTVLSERVLASQVTE